MARRNEVAAEKVVWIPPEALDRARGEYREVLGDEETHGGARTAPKYGDLIVWVDEAPDDPTNGSGYFKRYGGDESDYRPSAVEGGS